MSKVPCACGVLPSFLCGFSYFSMFLNVWFILRMFNRAQLNDWCLFIFIWRKIRLVCKFHWYCYSVAQTGYRNGGRARLGNCVVTCGTTSHLRVLGGLSRAEILLLCAGSIIALLCVLTTMSNKFLGYSNSYQSMQCLLLLLSSNNCSANLSKTTPIFFLSLWNWDEPVSKCDSTCVAWCCAVLLIFRIKSLKTTVDRPEWLRRSSKNYWVAYVLTYVFFSGYVLLGRMLWCDIVTGPKTKQL